MEKKELVKVMQRGVILRIAEIDKVWKNGIIILKSGEKYNPDGYKRGCKRRFSIPTRIDPLLESETKESIQAQIDVRHKEFSDKKEAKLTERKTEISECWTKHGKQWEASVKVMFGEKLVRVFEYEDSFGTKRMVFVYARDRQAFRGEIERVWTICGFNECKDRDADSLASYSSGSFSGADDAECLYELML